jgi:hypothetical protein
MSTAKALSPRGIEGDLGISPDLALRNGGSCYPVRMNKELVIIP